MFLVGFQPEGSPPTPRDTIYHSKMHLEEFWVSTTHSSVRKNIDQISKMHVRTCFVQLARVAAVGRILPGVPYKAPCPFEIIVKLHVEIKNARQPFLNLKWPTMAVVSEGMTVLPVRPMIVQVMAVLPVPVELY